MNIEETVLSCECLKYINDHDLQTFSIGIGEISVPGKGSRFLRKSCPAGQNLLCTRGSNFYTVKYLLYTVATKYIYVNFISLPVTFLVSLYVATNVVLIYGVRS